MQATVDAPRHHGMHRSGRSWRRVLGSGWLPALLVLALAVALLHDAARVSLRDQACFGGYLLGWIVGPGTVLWRSIDRRPNRPLVEDLAIGALVGYVVEAPVYLTCLALGHPHGYLLWPVVVLAITLAVPGGRRLLVRRGARMSPAWSWSVAALLAYVIVWFGRNVWGPAPAAGSSLRSPYLDEPYHLSLIASLRHFWPAKVLFVDHTPLDYHYLSHVHMAAASWISGDQPIVLLRALALPTVAVIVLLALAAAASRLSGRAWLGPVALAGVLVGPADFSGGTNGNGYGFLDPHLESSPSAGFTNVGLLLGTILVVELLAGRKGRPALWALTGLAMVAMCGAKAASLPTVLAGLLAATVVTSVATRRIAYRPLALTALAGAAFVVAKEIFFGSSSQGLSVNPLGQFDLTASSHPALAGPDGTPALTTALVIAISTLCALSVLGGVLAGLGKGGWREPVPVFFVGLAAAGYGASLGLHQVGNSEAYFEIVVQLPLILGGALGMVRYRDDLVRWGTGLGRYGGRNLALLAVASGLAGGLLYTAVNRPAGPAAAHISAIAEACRLYALPTAAVLLGGIVLTVLVVMLSGRFAAEAATARAGRLLAPAPVYAAVAVLVFCGLGMTPAVDRLGALVRDPVPTPVDATPGMIYPGGIEAARYLRSKSPQDAVIATNAHCQFPGTFPCSARNFWMAGYSERQFLVEGWSYVSRASVGMHAPKNENIDSAPFWDPRRLTDNDAVFEQPSDATVSRLEDRYGVRWLLVDLRYAVDLRGLRHVARLTFHDGAYYVFRLR
ncbi:MAG TPA: hypothetical protein VFE15_05685 [Marmoricola sp.]|jgi:hypothetical protein|nr:hypothetical protein [Marmoricola sp.]